MSTRSVIGAWNNSFNAHWTGVYCHWDGYASGVGATLFSEYNRLFKGNLKGMIDLLLSERVGWSILAGCDFSLKPIWVNSLDYRIDSPEYKALEKHPRSYSARGDSPINPGGDRIHSTDKDYIGCEWAYIFDINNRTMHIIRTRFFLGRWDWQPCAVIDLHGTEPDWLAMEG